MPPAPAPEPTPRPASPRPVAEPPPPAPEPPHLFEVDATPSSFSRRLLAFGIDALAVAALVALFLGLARAVIGPPIAAGASLGPWRHLEWWTVGGLYLALGYVYTTLLHALTGQTVGKRLLDLTVVTATARPPSLARSAARGLATLLSAAPLFFGFTLAFFTRSRRALHDLLAGTWVVRLDRD